MEGIDREHIEHSAKGVVGMTDFFLKMAIRLGRDACARLMRLTGIEAVYKTKSLSTLGKAVYIKPYLLRGLEIDHINQVWSIDITYIPMRTGFMYLTAIIDVYSRFIVGWSLHNTLDASNCINMLESAIRAHGAPENINSDQGCQFTSKEWADACADYPAMKISMDGRGRAKDNICIVSR